MARFSDEVINRIKSEVSLIRLVEAGGVAHLFLVVVFAKLSIVRFSRI